MFKQRQKPDGMAQEKYEIACVKEELIYIRTWLKDNDWKINKIVVGEWETTDERWTSYLEERAVKRARQDELNKILNGGNK